MHEGILLKDADYDWDYFAFLYIFGILVIPLSPIFPQISIG